MIVLEDRRSLACDIAVAHDAGARLWMACDIVGIDERTLQRWKAQGGLNAGDGRPQAVRPVPSHALSPAERTALLVVANEPRFASVPPARIVPMLADEGVYLASESSFARVLRANGQSRHRGRAKPSKAGRPPTTHIATGPGQVWCWDMTYLPIAVLGRWCYLYLILNLYSRKIVGWEVQARDHADHAAHLVRRTALAEGTAALATKPVLHGDNGATLKATAVLAMLQLPAKSFADLDAARAWATDFVRWYNHEHRHSGIRYVTPAQRHCGDDHALLAARHALYAAARERNPARWSGDTRNGSPILVVTLNPERDDVINTHLNGGLTLPFAA